MKNTSSEPARRKPSFIVYALIIVIGLALAGLFTFIGPLSLSLDAVYGEY